MSGIIEDLRRGNKTHTMLGEIAVVFRRIPFKLHRPTTSIFYCSAVESQSLFNAFLTLSRTGTRQQRASPDWPFSFRRSETALRTGGTTSSKGPKGPQGSSVSELSGGYRPWQNNALVESMPQWLTFTLGIRHPMNLASYTHTRDDLLERIVATLQADSRVVAAWLSGSFGRGVEDAWSDLDLHVAIEDE